MRTFDEKTIEGNLEKYQKEWQRLVENHAKLLEILEETEKKLQQLSGSIQALENLLQEKDKKIKEIDESLKETFKEVDKAETIINPSIRDITPTC